MTKEAEANYQAQYRALHRERLREYRARYQILKADKLRDQKARNYLRNKRSILAANKARYLKNKARYLQIAAKYYDANKIAVKGRVRAYAVRNRVKRNQYQKKRRTKDLNFKLAMSLRNRVNSALQQARSGKSARTPHLVGCDLKTLVAHLEAQFQPGMTWKNWAGKGWHIDHIRPCASFDLTDPEHQKTCFHYTNIQPLWCTENLRKGARQE